MKAYYSTKSASEVTGASRQVLRVYTTRYARYLSTEATPEAGGERRFTEADLKLLTYVYQQTSAGATHDQVMERLATGTLDTFAWQPPQEGPEATQGEQTAQTTALVPVAALQAAQALMLDSQRREQEAIEREQALRERLETLRQELGQAQGELAAMKGQRRKPPAWWVRLFGGRE